MRRFATAAGAALLLCAASTACHGRSSGSAAPEPTASAAESPAAAVTPAAMAAAMPLAGMQAIEARPPVVAAQVIARYPHDPDAFTQGLFVRDGKLYETTGLIGQSTLREVDLKTGKVRHRIDLPAGVFGEGSTDWGNQIYSITWRDGVAYRWDRKSFRKLGEFTYPGEGWGLTQDGKRLILSDGTSVIRFLDPKTFARTGDVSVTFAGTPLDRLNELEWVDGSLWANVWHENALVRIDPGSGKVTQVIDLTPLVAQVTVSNPEAVPNGIAWDAKTRQFLVTGKNWPALFQIALPPAP